MKNYRLTKLDNGLKVLTDYVPSVQSVATGVWIDAGTRDEKMPENGVAHMVEHMMFKGTPTRDALQIASEIESVGGQMNAYTSREITSYHVHLLKDDLDLALDIVSDIIQRSTMPEDEVERERHVILQEIGMTMDTPDDILFDYYQETAYPDQVMGAPILGREDIIRTMRRDTLMNYVDGFYSPARLVLAASGNVDHDHFVEKASELFGDLRADKKQERPKANYKGGAHLTPKDLEQAHVTLGFESFSRHDDDFYAGVLMTIILGGGMSSRLFQEIREKRGLAYSVFAHQSAYGDTGQMLVYAGTGADDLPELIPALCGEIEKIRSHVYEEELARAKSQLRADMLMGLESMMRRANQMSKHLIFHDEIIDLDEKMKRIEAVKTSDITRAAQKITISNPTLAALGPLGKLESYEKIRERLAA